MARIRAFRSTDLDRCVKLFVEVFGQEPWKDQWPSLDRAREYLSDLIGTPGFRGVVVYDGSAVLGMCFGHKVRWWAGDEFYIDEFCIDSQVQRTGLGTRLVEHLKRQLLDEGVQFAVLLTEKGTLAERFWVKQRFGTSSKMVFMYRRLDE